MDCNYEYVLDAFSKQLIDNCDYVCLKDDLGNSLTRKELDKQSACVYHYLKENHVSKEDFVLINLERSIKPIVAMLGVIKCGAAFVLVENTYAANRIEYIKKDCNVKIEINESLYERIMKSEPIDGYELADDKDACFAVYTSGTTGTPKGVIHEYGQLKLEMISHLSGHVPFVEDSTTSFAVVAPLNMVASIKIFVHFLYIGICLHVLSYDTIKNPKKFSAYFNDNKITGSFLSPSLLKLKGKDLGPYIKCVYTGSEPANDISLDNSILVNLYTMSESMFTVSRYVITDPMPVCPIGRPTFDLDYKLIDENGNDVGINNVGEFVFYNPFCRGYINNEKENAIHFKNGYYYTGDLASRDENGLLTIKGRKDDMIKIDGNRIEPGEIEASFNNITGAKSSVAKGYEKEGFIVLYYVDDISFDEETLITEMKKYLPYYMIPALFVKIDEIPLTPLGKIDRKSLPLPKDKLKGEYVEPRDEFEEKLVKVFEEILEINHVGIKDDFYKLGGSSIKTMEVIEKMDDEILTPTMILQGRNIEKISEIYKIAKMNYLPPIEKEMEARKHKYPLSPSMKWYREVTCDNSIDFYFALKFNFFVPATLIAKGVNKYIDSNSTFNMVLEEGENGEELIVYKPDKPYVKVEYTNEKKIKELQREFVRPFGQGEPFIRIKVCRTLLHTYLFVHACHFIGDGAAVHKMVDHMMDCIKGKQVEPTYYFSWVFDEQLRVKSPNLETNLKYFEDEYFNQTDYDICIKSDENTGMSGVKEASPAKADLKKISEYCDRVGISRNNFLTVCLLLTQAAYNKTDKNLVMWNYNNRGSKESEAGVMVRTLCFKVDLSKISTIDDVYSEIKKQNEESMWRSYDMDYYVAFKRLDNEPCELISYMEDWFSMDSLPKILGTDIPLENTYLQYSPDAERCWTISCTHEQGQMVVKPIYGSMYIKDENMAKFVKMFEYCMNEIVDKNILPSFDKFN